MENLEVIEAFLRPCNIGDGYGDGSGYGYGDGDGYGDGYGYGYGSGYGSGSGYGDGYGDGDGYGYGYGEGYGDGDGDGYGYGYGDGYGKIVAFASEKVWYVDGVPTFIDHIRGDIAEGRILNDDLSMVPCYIARVENSFAHGKTLREAVMDAESKAMEELPEEERIARFVSAFPSLDSTAKCEDFYRWHHTLTGSCRMGRDNFVKSHNLDMEKEYTVRYFLDITKEEYGRETIKKTLKHYGTH